MSESIDQYFKNSLGEDATRKVQFTRFMRSQEISFYGRGLCPDKKANVFFDKVDVKPFTQKSNRLTVTNVSSPEGYTSFWNDEPIINSTTNAYAKVIFSSGNFVYLNENFINVNVAPYAANTLTSTTVIEQDVVYQTASDTVAGQITFAGIVERYQNTSTSHAYMAIKPIDGSFRKFSPNSVIFLRDNQNIRLNVSSTQTAGNTFPVGSNVYSVGWSAGKTATVTAHEHYSGVISYAAANDTNVIHVSGNLASAVGNTFRIAAGAGVTAQRTINAVSANGFMVTLSANVAVSSNSRYSYGDHEVDDYGALAGIFHIPEADGAFFPTGLYPLTITDAPSNTSESYTMKAMNYYGAGPNSGYARLMPMPSISAEKPVAAQVQDTSVNNRKFYPLSQTFFTPATQNTHSGGVSTQLNALQISSIDLYFSSKPTSGDLELPVMVTINEFENGLPSTKILGQSMMEARDVKTSVIPFADSDFTTFRFSPPVIVKPSKEYAITVTTSSPDYSLFVAEIGGSILGTTPPRRVSEQPYIGQFFKAQNASNWSPIPNEDLMFRVRYNNWASSSSNSVIFMTDNILSNINVDSLLIHSSDFNFKPTSVDYYFKSTSVDGTQDADWKRIRKNQFYDFGGDLETSSKTGTRRRRIAAGNNESLLVKVDLSTSDPYIAPTVDMESISAIATEYVINDAGISVADITLTNLGQHSNAANITIAFSAPDRIDGETANAYVAALSPITGYTGNVSVLVVDRAGSGYYKTPTITFSEPGVAVNAAGVIAGEDRASGGNCKAKYVSKIVTLADGFDAGDLRVYLDCNRPVGTDIAVYYKIKSADDNQSFEEKKWQLMHKVNENFSKDQNQIIELEYRPSLDYNKASYVEDGITYPLGGKFKYYAIKIVMTAGSAAIVPHVRNYRAIATPSG